MKDYALRRMKKDTSAVDDELAFLLKEKKGDVKTNVETRSCKKDDLESFFQSISSTMRKFPPMDIAITKKQISDIVSEKEIALSTPEASNVQLVYEVNGGQQVIDMANVQFVSSAGVTNI